MSVANNIPKGWVETTLGEVADIIMGQSPKGDTCNVNNEGAPLLNGPTEFGEISPQPIQFTIDPKKISNINDLLFCVRGSTTGRMNWSNKQYAIGRGIAAIRHKKGEEYRKYIKGIFDYKLKSLLAEATGSTFPNVSRSQLENIEINLPPLQEQKAIANILTAFDDKIALLQAQNKTLETTAQTIFKEWFGKYQIGDELPDGWRVEPLEKLSKEITRGFTTKYVEKSNLINLNQKVNKGKYLDKQHFKYYSEDTIVPENKFIKKYDILLNSLGQGTLGRIHFYTEETNNVIADQHISILRFDNNLSFYIYQVLSSKYGQFRLENEITGSTGMLMLNIGKVREFKIIMPDDNLLLKYKNTVKPLFKKLELNNSQIQTLKKTRDTLLPKLMSGQLRVTGFKE